MMISDQDYTFMENPMSENWVIRILRGTYAEVMYTYGKIGLVESPSGDSATLKFNYKILDAGDLDENVLKYDVDFNNHLGDILSHILDESLRTDKFRIGKDSDRADSNNSTKEPDPE